MATVDHLFIQPWLQPDESWAGFQIACASHSPSGGALAKLFSLPDIQSLNSGLLWFVQVETAADVQRTMALPPERVVLLLKPPADPADHEDAERLESDLRRAGRKLGVILESGDPLPPTGTWNYVVLSAGHARTLSPFTLIGLSARTTIVVNSVRTRNDFAWATSNQCALLSGEYLLTRHAATSKPDVTRLKLLELLALVAQDADTPALEEVFKQQPKLSYGLLRLVNSAAMAPRSPITSFAQAINLMGRRQLQRWLQLLVYADASNGAAPNPLLLLAARRGRQLELLSERIPAIEGIEHVGDAAFMVGTFSLLDILLNLSMADILPQLPLPAPVHDALAHHAGPLGSLLKIVDAAEHCELTLSSQLLAEQGIDRDIFLEAQVSALSWACKIRSQS